MTFASLSTQVGVLRIGVKRAHDYPAVAVPPVPTANPKRLTKAIAMENGPAIRANVVAPSAVDTAFLGGGTADGGEQPGADSWFKQNVEAYVASIPLGRLATADDIVGPILFLAGPGSRYITGQVIHVNGGRITP
jgi:NAD(P)-dependent dehydrogenase (short-subunit alcohol dehydrogenase family)